MQNHGTDPQARLQRIHVLVRETHGAYFGVARTLISRRKPDGTGWAGRKQGPQGLKSKVLWMGKGIAESEAHAAALTAAAGVWRTQPIDETHALLPSEESLRLLYSLGQDVTSWAVGGPRPLGSFCRELRPLLRRAQLQVGGGNPDTLNAMSEQLQAELAVHGGEETDELLSWIAFVQRSRRGIARPVCSCGKSRFVTEALAELAILQFSGRPGRRPVRAYPCPDSSWFHVTGKLLWRTDLNKAG